MKPIKIDKQWYLQTYNDVLEAGVDPASHFERHGRAEGRSPYALEAPLLEKDLWRGMTDEAISQLSTLATCNDAGERVWANWALGRWYAGAFDWKRAEHHLKNVLGEPTKSFFLPAVGPGLLSAVSAIRLNDFVEARRRIVMVAPSAEGSDLSLLEAYLAASNHSDADFKKSLQGLFSWCKTKSVTLNDKSAPVFDRLECKDTGASWLNNALHALCPKPTVSVIMPTYNAKNFVSTALRSIQSQTWQNLEIIVVDDASTDGTAEIVSSFSKLDPRIKLIVNNENCGTYISRNIALSKSSGSFFTVHDADDWSHPTKIETQLRALLRDRSKVGSISSWARVTSDFQPYHWRLGTSFVHRNVSSLMMRIEARDNIGYWDRVKADGDTEYYYRVLAISGPESIAEVHSERPLSLGRVQHVSLTQQSPIHIRSQLFGVRQAYQASARRWHASQANNKGALRLPQILSSRRFPVPPELSVGDENGELDDYAAVNASGLFDPAWYLRQNADIRRSSVEPLAHFVEHGVAEGRDPGPYLNTTAYRMAYGSDIINPIIHWTRLPASERPPTLPTFKGRVSAGRSRALVFAHASEERIFGAERSLIDFLDMLTRSNIQPTLVLPKIGSKAYLDKLLARTESIHFRNYGWWNGRYPSHRPTIDLICGLISDVKPDFVCVNTLVLDAPLIAARRLKCPTITYVRELPDQDPDLCATIGLSAEEIHLELLKRSDLFIANSELTARWLACPDQTTVVGNSADRQLLNLTYEPERNLRFSLISSNIKKKGIRHAIDLAERLLVSAPETTVQLIGPITNDLRETFPLPSNINILGYIEEPLDALATTDVVMSLSDFSESFGRTVLEAHLAARPVICFDNGYPARIVQDGRTGFVVPYGDIDQLEVAALHMINNRELLNCFSLTSRENAKSILASSQSQADNFFKRIANSN